MTRLCTGIALAVAGVFASSSVQGQEIERRLRLYPLLFLEPSERDPESLPRPASLERRDDDGSLEFVGLEDPSEVNALQIDDVEDIIVALIDSDSWNNRRNSISLQESSLRVVQTPEVLARIESFLRLLEHRVTRTVRVDLALVPIAALERVSADWHAPGATPWLDGSVFDQAVAEAGDEAVFFSTPLQLSRTRRVPPRGRVRRLSDHQLNSTGVAPTINPVVETRRAGAYAEFSVSPSPNGSWFRVEVRLGRLSDRIRDVPRLPGGDLQLLSMEQVDIETTVLASPERTVVIGGVRPGTSAAEAEGRSVPPPFVGLLRVAPIAGEASEPDSVVSILDARLLLLPPQPRYRSDEPSSDVHERRTSAQRSALEEIMRSLERVLGASESENGEIRWILSGGFVFVRRLERTEHEFVESLEEIARVRTPLVQVDFLEGSLTSRDAEGDRGDRPLLEGTHFERFHRDARLHARAVALAGAGCLISSVSSRSYLADFEQVSGGTGFRIIEESDPVIEYAAGGLEARAIAHLVPGRSWIRLRLSGTLAAAPRLERRGRARLGLKVDVESDGKGERVRASGPWFEIELPDEERRTWDHLVTVPAGRAVVLQAVPGDAGGEVTALVAIVRAFRTGGDGSILVRDL